MKKRVLHVITSMGMGGAQSQIMKYYRSINRDKIQFDFLLLDTHEGYYEEEINKLGGYIYRVNGSTKKSIINNIFFIIKILKKYEIVHTHCQYFNGFINFFAKISGTNIRISHSHIAGDSKSNGVFRNIYVYICKNLIKMFSTHRLSCSDKASIFLYNSKEMILKNALNVDDYVTEIDKNKYKNLLGFNHDDILIGHIGRFHIQKNHKFLLDLFVEIEKHIPNAKLVLVGDGELKNEMENYVRHKGIDEKVFFLGIRDDIPQLLKIFDLMLFPSLFEGLPLVLIEAQAAGLKVIASDTITNEVNMDLGLIEFKPLEVDAWLKAVDLIMKKNIKLTPKFINASFENKGYSINSQVELLELIYM